MKFNKNQIVFNRWGHCLTRKASGIIAIFILGVMFSCTIIDPLDGLKAPTFKSSSISTNTVTLSWEWNTDYDVTSYILSNQTAGENITIKANSGESESRIVTNLKPNTEYTFYLKACGGWGCSADSSLKVTTRPDPPDNFVSVEEKNTSSSLSFTWDAPTSGAAHYALYWGDGVVAENITSTEQSVDGLNPGTEYIFGLVACNKNDLCSTTNEQTFTTPPAMVTGLMVSKISSNTATISWTKPQATQAITSYVVSKQKGSGTIEEIANPPTADDTQFTISNLTAGTKYTFSLQACNAGGCSELATIVGQTETVAPASAPVNLRFTSVSSTVVKLVWDPVEGATYYPVLYTTGSGSEVSNQVNGIEFATNNLAISTQYTFSVKACNTKGCSDLSDSVEVTTSSPQQDFFTISYPNMGSTVSDTSTPTIVSGKDCDLRGLTDLGLVAYTVAANTSGTTDPTLPTIDPNTGVVNNNGNATPGAYKVTVTVADTPACSTNVLVYNTITPANKAALKDHLFPNSSSSKVALHGDSGDYNYIDTSKVMSFQELFSDKYGFNGDISEWDTSKVKYMHKMFNNAYAFNQPLNNWDTSNVINMNNMFYSARVFDQPLSNWDTSKVRNMSQMFQGALVFNQNIGEWETSNVTTMMNMFKNAREFDQPLSNWNTSQVTDMSEMFSDAWVFNQSLSNWNTSQVWNMSQMFYNANEFNRPLNNWNTSQVTDMSGMFKDANIFNQPLSNWNTSQVENMSEMFLNAESFNQDLSGWTVDKVTSHVTVFNGSGMQDKTIKHPTWNP